MSDSSFRPELYTDPEQYEETATRDRKVDLCGLKPSDTDNRKRAELVRDIISLANAASWRKKPAYLLMGIDDDGNRKGLAGELEHFGYGENEFVKVKEAVRRRFHDEISNHIKPLLKWDIEGGIIDGKPFLYLSIEPARNLEPYRVKKQIKAGAKSIATDTCWIRDGESKQEIRPQELLATDWARFLEVPQPLPSQWQRYFESLQSDGMFSEAQNIEYYLNLHVDDHQKLDDLLTGFLNDSQKQLLFIQGSAGCGKSTFLKRLVLQLADEGLSAIRDISFSEQFLPPPGWIPLYFSLREYSSMLDTTSEFAKALVESVNHRGRFWDEPPTRPEGLFEQGDFHWLVCLDGLDEIWSEDKQQKFLGTLRGFLHRYPRVKLLLTSRPEPESVSVSWQDWTATLEVHIRQLSEEQVQDYILAQTEPDIGNDVLEFIRSHEEMWRLCSRVSYLNAAMRKLGRGDEQRPLDDPALLSTHIPEGRSGQEEPDDQVSENSVVPEPISLSDLILEKALDYESDQADEQTEEDNEKQYSELRMGQILDSIYNYLWERECERRMIQSYKAGIWREKTGELAVKTDGFKPTFGRRTVEQYMTSESAVFWLLGIGVITGSQTQLFSFFTELTKVYFAAYLVLQRLDSNDIEQPSEMLRDCKPEFSEQVIRILQDISPEYLPSNSEKGANHEPSITI